jgi:transcriptional regulator with XRE-family HTH domain
VRCYRGSALGVRCLLGGRFSGCIVVRDGAPHNASDLPPDAVTHAPLLINELERIRRERGWTVRALAQQLGVSTKLFYNMRRGYRPLSVPTLSAIAKAFGADYRIREAVMHYLALECPVFERAVFRDGASTAELPDSISYHNRWRIVSWVGKVPFGEGVQRGLYLLAKKPETLSAVSRFLARALDRAGVHAVVLAANARPSASHAAAAGETAVLIVDRIEFASDELIAILSRRADAQRPVVVTSCVDRETLPDGVLLRTLRPTTELVRLDPVSRLRAKPVRSSA